MNAHMWPDLWKPFQLNRTLEVKRQSILKISKHYNQPRIVSTQMKLTQKLDHFTVLKSFPSTSGCSRRFPTNNLENWLDVWGSISDVFIRWGAGTGGKRLQFKIVVARALVKPASWYTTLQHQTRLNYIIIFLIDNWSVYHNLYGTY